MAGLWNAAVDPMWDERGSFGEILNTAVLKTHGIEFGPVQANLSVSARQGQVRGMHYQAAPHAQAKLVLAQSGRIYDAVVDLRMGARSFGQWYGVSLTPGNGLYIPAGFAHGWQAIDAGAELLYFVDAPWHPSAERGLSPLDPAFLIPWPVSPILCAPRDLGWPAMATLDWDNAFGKER
jgi:dTDP-4-dehydrorhamnose 3,5-epimerase